MGVANYGEITFGTSRVEGHGPEGPGLEADAVVESDPDVAHGGLQDAIDIEVSCFEGPRWHNHFGRPRPWVGMERDDDRSVRRLPTRPWGGAMNMALDAVAAETVAEGGPASVRVYEWEPSTLSLGYAQDPATVDWEYCRENGIEVTRRPTGGGGIYHDSRGDISYSIVYPRDALPDELTAAYQRLCQPLLAAFDSLDIPVRFAASDRDAAYHPACYLRGLHPAHDLVVPTDGGERKISGNAQHRQRDAVVQHGSILHEIPAERHLACFDDPAADEGTFEARTTAITDHVDVDRETVIDTLERALTDAFGATDGDWTEAELGRAEELVETRFGAEEWVERAPTSEA